MVKGSLLRFSWVGLLVALVILCPVWAGEQSVRKDGSRETSTVLICSINTEDHAQIEIVESPQPRSPETAHPHLRSVITAAKTMWRAVQTVVSAVATYMVQLLLSVGMIVVHWFLVYLGAG